MTKPPSDGRRGAKGFFAPGAAKDPAYVWYRDSEYGLEGRAYVEGLWERYCELCGDREIAFLGDARANFRQRVWEMRLACLLVDRGHRLERPPADAPDIKCHVDNMVVWLEAIAPDVGSVPDDAATPVLHRIADTDAGAVDVVQLDHDKMVLRYTSAIAAKRKQYGGFTARGVVDPAHAYVIAINASAIPHADVRPDIVRAVYGRDNVTYSVPVLGNTGPVRLSWPSRPAVEKPSSGAHVSTAIFLDDQAPEVSAVLFSATLPPWMSDLGGVDVHVLHNPYAHVPLSLGTFQFGREWWFDVALQQPCCRVWS